MSPELELAVAAAHEAGGLLRRNFESELAVDAMHRHDIKLALDVESQHLIERRLLETFPDHAIYGEEGVAGREGSETEWIVDPIDGTVNYFYGIPHFCVSIAMRREGEIRIGAIHDPMLGETYAVDFEGPATRNGEPVAPSARASLAEAVVTIGFSKDTRSIDAGLARYREVAHRVRKTRMMGSAALALAYIACGRLDAYIEESLSLWDIAAGQLMVERGGGSVALKPLEGGADKFSIVAHNGHLDFDGI
jgi:myo-inositol-1(or 4)-monophosphatase